MYNKAEIKLMGLLGSKISNMKSYNECIFSWNNKEYIIYKGRVNFTLREKSSGNIILIFGKLVEFIDYILDLN